MNTFKIETLSGYVPYKVEYISVPLGTGPYFDITIYKVTQIFPAVVK